MMLQYSERRFSTGVPLMAMKLLAGMAFTARVCAVAGFLMFCASSTTSTCQASALSAAASLRAMP
jgi:hypothetical protein